MANYLTKQISKSYIRIDLSGKPVGSITYRDNNWHGILDIYGQRVTSKDYSWQVVFDVLVRGANRISICGENSEEKARAVLAVEREEIKTEAANVNGIFAKFGLPDLVKVNNRKVKI